MITDADEDVMNEQAHSTNNDSKDANFHEIQSSEDKAKSADAPEFQETTECKEKTEFQGASEPQEKTECSERQELTEALLEVPPSAEEKVETAAEKTEEPVQKIDGAQGPGGAEAMETEEIPKESHMDEPKAEKRVLKRKPTLDGGYVERYLSEGETSTSYESISSINSSSHFDEYSNAPSDVEADSYQTAESENKMICDDLPEPRQNLYYREDRNYSRRFEDYSRSSRGRSDDTGSSSHYDSWRRGSEDREYRLQQNWLRDQDDLGNSRDGVTPDRQSTYCVESRSRRPSRRHAEEISTSREGRELDYNRGVNGSESLPNRSSRHRSRRTSSDSRSPSYKVRRAEENPRSQSLSRPSTSSYRDYGYECVTSQSAPTTWEYFDNSESRDKAKRSQSKKSTRAVLEEHHRKKEELNNLLIDLKIKLKQAKRDMNTSKPSTSTGRGMRPQSEDRSDGCPEDNRSKIPSSRNTQMAAYSTPGSNAPASNLYQMDSQDYSHMPNVSLENLPLVPGESGLPVHVTETGEQILHDMDGRRIPIGPNGLYLPLDPTGRLFPHIISPRHQAVPIHMTPDGVLRLPNSDPVPYGPLHNLPVNIDGSAILVGPDSKPLTPCRNLPTEAPLGMLQMAQSHPSYTYHDPNEASYLSMTTDVGRAAEARNPNDPQPTTSYATTQYLSNPYSNTYYATESSSDPPYVDITYEEALRNNDPERNAPNPHIMRGSILHGYPVNTSTLHTSTESVVVSPDGPVPSRRSRGRSHDRRSHSRSQERQAKRRSQERQVHGRSHESHGHVQSQESYYRSRSHERSMADLPRSYQRRNEEEPKRKATERTPEASPSKGPAKRSLPDTRKRDPRRAQSTVVETETIVIDSSDSESSTTDDDPQMTKWTEVPTVEEVVTFLKENFCDKDDADVDSPGGSMPNESVLRNVQRAIKALKKKNYKPPPPGRFILPEVEQELIVDDSPNISPLLRNRVQLPFITPNANTSSSASQPMEETKSKISFKFLDLQRARARERARRKEEKKEALKKYVMPLCERDAQCDFTSEEINHLNTRIAELEMEISHLRTVNSNLLDSYKGLQTLHDRKKEELDRALAEIQKKSDEILALKRIIEKKKL